MTDWPRMESKVTINRAFFFSAYFIENYSTGTREKMSELEGKELTVCGMGIFRIDRRCDVTPDGNVVYSVPLEFVDPDESETENEKVESRIDWFLKASQGNPQAKEDNASEAVSFGFANDTFLDDAILFFARNGYKAWVEDEQYNILTRVGRLMVEKPKEGR